MTISTERIKQYATDEFMFVADDVRAMARELLAVREAQSADFILGMDVSIDVSTCDSDAGHRLFGTVTEVSELDGAKNGYILLVQDAVANFTAPPATAVPEERSAFERFVAQRFGESVDQRRAKNGDNEYMAWDMAMAWIVWQGRAAMLQPVSQGYTLNSPVTQDGWKLMPVELTEEMIAKAWREALGKCDHETIKRMYTAMLSAAPTPIK